MAAIAPANALMVVPRSTRLPTGRGRGRPHARYLRVWAVKFVFLIWNEMYTIMGGARLALQTRGVACVCPRPLDSDLDLTIPRRGGSWERSRPEPAPATALVRARPEKGGGGGGGGEWELAAWRRRRRARKGRC